MTHAARHCTPRRVDVFVSPAAYLTADVTPIPFVHKQVPEDFFVEEILSFEPDGEGDHVYVFIEKRALSTARAIQILADAGEADRRLAGYAGKKDVQAVTRQWLSFEHVKNIAALENFRDDGLRVLKLTRNGRRLKLGRVKENAFRLRLRDFESDRYRDLEAVLRRIEDQGLPNYFGAQRFGKHNLRDAERWLIEGAKGPRDRQRKRFLVSVLQSAIFNRYLSDRIEDGLFATPLLGDLAKIHQTGGVFWVDDVNAARSRVERMEISATGPMPGLEMRAPRDESHSFEEKVLSDLSVAKIDWSRAKKVASGTRRPIRVPIKNVALEKKEDGCQLSFSLPSGAYATSVLRELRKDA